MTIHKAADHTPGSILVDDRGRQWECVLVPRWAHKDMTRDKFKGQVVKPEDLPKIEELSNLKAQADKLAADIKILQQSMGV